MKTIARLAAALLLSGISASAFAAVEARLDRQQVQAGESVELSLQREGGGGDPDLAPLKQDFDVLGTSTGSSISMINGSISRQHEVRLTLSPRHGGKLTIPPISWGGEQSPALQLTVGDAPAAAAGGDHQTDGARPHVYLTSRADDARPYVQSAVLLTVQVHTDLPLYQAALELNGNSDLLVQPIGQDQQSQQTEDGRTYNVVERHYLLQPQRSGTIELPGVLLDAQVPDIQRGGNGAFFGGMMSRPRPIRLHGDAIRLEVRPRPPGAGGANWLPASRLELRHSVRPDNASVHAGEPLTLQATLYAEGMTGEQLPDLARLLVLPQGIKAYPDQAKAETSLRNGAITGSRSQDIALIASKPGRYRVPELRLQWWDTRADTAREIVMPERTIEVLPAEGGSTIAAPPAPAASETEAGASPPAPATSTAAPIPADLASPGSAARGFWTWLSLALGLLWLATALAWWRTHRRGRRAADAAVTPRATAAGDPPKAGAARSAFQQACRDNDAPAARRHLLAWARAVDPAHAPAGLNALAQRVDPADTRALIAQLDRACYSGGDWQGPALAQALTALPVAARAAGDGTILSPLYP